MYKSRGLDVYCQTEFCIRRKLWEFLHDYPIEWHDSCGECISFTTSKYPTSTIEYGTLYYELKCKIFYRLFNTFCKYYVCCIVHVKIKNNVLFCCNVRVYFCLPTSGRISLQKETLTSVKSRKWDRWMLSSTTYLWAILLVLLRKTKAINPPLQMECIVSRLLVNKRWQKRWTSLQLLVPEQIYLGSVTGERVSQAWEANILGYRYYITTIPRSGNSNVLRHSVAKLWLHDTGRTDQHKWQLIYSNDRAFVFISGAGSDRLTLRPRTW